MSSSDDEYVGDFVISFAAFLPKPLDGVVDELTGSVGLVVKNQDGELSVIKFPPKVAQALSDAISQHLNSLPKSVFDDALQHRAMEIFDKHVPKAQDFPTETRMMSKAEYVKFVHLNAYAEAVKIDVNFFDGSSKRFTFTIGVAMAFADTIDEAIRISR